MKIHKGAAVLIAGTLGPDAILHLFWATTRKSWPAADFTSLSRDLLNVDASFEPLNLVVIASMPAAAAVLALARAGMLGAVAHRLPAWMPKLGTIALAAGASARLVAGIVWALGIGADTASTFYRLNLTVYTPLCAVLVAAAIAVLRAPEQRTGKARDRGRIHAPDSAPETELRPEYEAAGSVRENSDRDQ